MLYTTTFCLMLASLPFQSFANATKTLKKDAPDSPGTLSIPITYTLAAASVFVANIAVGSQGTEMDIIMDLGSPFSWIYGPNDIAWGNESIAGPFNCHYEWTPYYSPNTSTTASVSQLDWGANYGGNSKQVSGDVQVIDTILVGPSSSGFRIPFDVASTTTVREQDTDACANPPLDYGGIFGISGSANESDLLGASFRYNVQHPPPPQAPLIDSATISIFLRNATTTPALQTMSGEVLLGGIDTSAFVGPLVSIANATIDPYFGYTLPLPSLSVAGVQVTFDPALASDLGGCLVDSGSHEDVWPINVVFDYLYDDSTFLAQTGLLHLTRPNNEIVYAYPSACADMPSNATFDFTWPSPSGQNVTIKVPMRNYARVTTEVDDQSCALNIDVIGCTLGAPFLSGTYFAADDDAGIVALAQSGEGTGGPVAIRSGEGIPGLIS